MQMKLNGALPSSGPNFETLRTSCIRSASIKSALRGTSLSDLPF